MQINRAPRGNNDLDHTDHTTQGSSCPQGPRSSQNSAIPFAVTGPLTRDSIPVYRAPLPIWAHPYIPVVPEPDFARSKTPGPPPGPPSPDARSRPEGPSLHPSCAPDRLGWGQDIGLLTTRPTPPHTGRRPGRPIPASQPRPRSAWRCPKHRVPHLGPHPQKPGPARWGPPLDPSRAKTGFDEVQNTDPHPPPPFQAFHPYMPCFLPHGTHPYISVVPKPDLGKSKTLGPQRRHL